MNKQVRQTETSGTVKAVSVADYIVERLAAEGIEHWRRKTSEEQVRAAGLLWVNDRHSAMSALRLLHPDERTLMVGSCRSASGH